MKQKYVNKNFDDIMNEVKKYMVKPENLELIQRAYEYANEKHSGQFRRSGEPYVTHVLNVGYILATLRSSPQTIAAGLLHDTIEDCDVDEEEFKKLFGDEIFLLVQGVTKIGNLKFKDEKEYQAENHRKIFIAMAKDVRVILIKLVDRLHNMLTLQYMPEEKQMKIAAETLEVYAPIAHRLGISEIKNELEDLSFMYLNREKYFEIAHLVEKKKAERDGQVSKMIEEISQLLNEHHIKFRIFGRSKHLYSIYKKMINKHKRFDEILDLLAIRIICDDVGQCYEILGYIHATYRPIPGRFKDYIAMPKVNMYQSLHTTIVAEENIFEVQIRTEEMDQIAEQGIAAHWAYKENISLSHEKEQKEIEEKLTWLKEFALMSGEDGVSDDAKEYMNLLQKDIFEANVYVMSPKGRVIVLPNGSTPIDFAYRIHTEVGHKMVGATVNGAIVPLNTVLKTGDVVSIRTSNQSTGPSEDWLKIVKSTHARNKIRAFYQKKENEKKSAAIEKGKDMLADELKRRSLNADDYMERKKMESVVGALTYPSLNDLYYAIGTKAISAAVVVDRLVNHTSSKSMDNEELVKMFNRNETKRKRPSKCGVYVKGIDTMTVNLAACCKPIPGDEIVGYVTKSQGVKVHRCDCPNIINEKSRIIDVYWDDNLEEKDYEVEVLIASTDRSFLLSDIVTVVSQNKAGLIHVDSKVMDDKISVTTMLTVLVKNAEHLRTLMANLKKVNSVISVERMIH
ncbi:bifunctional (p)ppGpp synthetase/guanosine-3',5'-bis(diphosphate) 3'-pyrophosphohydrolase [uncultured Traorella sp.]|uniref:RelA/SpoT family protein n=1 Tax=uncultured Traorella sp. TaxID=1929048 RepID=UPI0025D41F9F|nr:bifunctional (p)ppGpp synthetase/guanosine-3',5'-bis(diphosphate) 3'-pyrophosphohydrolase [uncultured Traorella sp.]